MNSSTGSLTQLKAPAAICVMLAPCLAGDVLKWKLIVRLPFDKANESAGIPFTVKSLASRVAGSTAPVTSTWKITGGGGPGINLSQGPLVITEQGAALGVGLGVGVPVGVGVGGACAQYLAPVLPPASPPQMIMSLPLQIAVWYSQAEGAELMLVGVQLFSAGLYRPLVVDENKQSGWRTIV